MKNKFLTLFLALAPSVGTIFAETYSGYCGTNLTWTLDTESGILTISGTGAMKDYIYDSSPWYSYRESITTVKIGSSVTNIGEGAFYFCSSLTSITIPNSVTSIGNYAFYGCSKLTSVTIPNSVTSIGGSAFFNCSSLTSLTIPSSVTSIGEYAFYYCSSLTSVTIPNSVTSIGSSTFYGCSSLPIIDGIRYADTYLVEAVNKTLSTYNIKQGTRWIGSSAFSSCSSLTSITIPNSVTTIGNNAFRNCSSLTSPVFNAHVFAKMPESYSGAYTIPDGIESIAGGAFYKCSSLTSVTIPNSVTSIGEYAFFSCSKLTSVTIPNSVTSIGDNAFENCSSLTSVTIPNSVISIGQYAFYSCSGLTSITIPNSVTSIGRYAFEYCRSLTSITCEAVNPPKLGDKVFEGVNKSIPLYVPSSAVQKYKLVIGWKDFTYIQPISSQTGDVTTPTVTVTTTSADIAWPQISGAASYELVIKDKSGNVVCTLVFDAEGHLTSLNFGAPDRDNIRKQPQAGTFSFTVTGLKENTEYTYTLTAKDSQGKAIDTKTGTFKTSGGTPVDETERDAAPAPRKQMKNGILRILTPNGITYDLQGHRLD